MNHLNVFGCGGKLRFEKAKKEMSKRCLEFKAVFVLEDALSVCVSLVVCIVKDGRKTQVTTGVIIPRFAP